MQLKEDQWESLYVFAKNLAENNVSFSEIEHQLSNKTTDTVLITEITNQVKKVHYAVKRKNGLIKLGFGVLFLVAGFLITCINFHANQSFTIVMYSSSSIGLLLIFWGLYEIIG
jgi:hypothetical protein